MWHWEHQQVVLGRSHRIITPDMPGSGLSEKPERVYSPAFLLETVRAFMDHLRIEKAVMAGSSMGAGIAIGMSLKHPDRIAGLVLIGGFPSGILDNLQSSRTRRFIERRPAIWLSKLGSRITGRWSIKLILKEIIHDHALISPMVVERVHRLRFQPGFFQAMYSQIDQIPEWETTFAPRLAEISHPHAHSLGRIRQHLSPFGGANPARDHSRQLVSRRAGFRAYPAVGKPRLRQFRHPAIPG